MAPEVQILDVSVIIPAYRAARTIGRALDSVVTQTRRPCEVVVVDDGSPDDTFAATEACRTLLAEAGITLKLFRQENKGAGAARNRAIREATSQWLAFLDADDEWLPEKLARSLEVAEAGDHVLVAHNGWIVDADGKTELNDCKARFDEGPDPYVTLYRKGYLDTCTVLARRDAVVAVGGFDESLPNAQDFELWLALLAAPGCRFTVFADALSRYHLVAGSIMSYTERRRRCTLEIAERYAGVLKGRPGGVVVNLMWRILAIHHEALTVQRSKGDPRGAAWTLARLPLAMIGALWRVTGSTERPRRLPLGAADAGK